MSTPLPPYDQPLLLAQWLETAGGVDDPDILRALLAQVVYRLIEVGGALHREQVRANSAEEDVVRLRGLLRRHKTMGLVR